MRHRTNYASRQADCVKDGISRTLKAAAARRYDRVLHGTELLDGRPPIQLRVPDPSNKDVVLVEEFLRSQACGYGIHGLQTQIDLAIFQTLSYTYRITLQ